MAQPVGDGGKSGRVLLTRQMNGGEAHDTYTVYDNYGNVRFVLPPLAADSLTAVQSYAESHPVLQKYAYIYHYDKYNRCIYKKLPGCDPVYTIYDAADRPVFTQDGEQRERNEWSFSIPDGFGRVVLSGICKNQPAYGAESTPLDTVVVKAVWANEENPLKGYRLEGITLSSPTVLSVSYYDSYDFLGKNGIPDDATTAYSETAGYGKRYGDDCKGQQTGSLTALFTDREYTGFIYSALYYDDRYRVIQRKGNNGQHGTESVYTAYNFEGSPTKEKHVHSVPGQAPVTEVHTYTYDLANRLLKSVYQLNDKDSITLVDNIYDEVGRLFVDRRNGVPELRTNYSYNLRSWLKGVSSPLFSQTLNYQETINDISPCYNGNISSLFWRTAQNNASNALISSPEKGYGFTYDGLSRLKDAVYGEGASLNQNRNRFNEQITGYDKMGNILGLLRYGQTGTDSYGLIDNLNLTYNGNQLESVYDNATNSVFGNGMEFKDVVHETVEYAYDKNGNLTKDLNKNITEIQYNILNLPSHITFADGNSIVYEYAADGSKVRTTHTINDNVTSTVYCGNAVYENGSLKILLNESGYYSFQDNKFHFYIKDHQGNIRVVADETGKVDEVNDYYPFGGLMSNVCNNVQSYKYNGKELDRKGGLDWYDYGARHYDAMIGRWHTVDPSAAKYYRWGPYVYCKNSPVNRIDLDGKDDYTINSAGRLFRTVVEGSTSDRLMSTRSGVEPVTVNDKELLSGMYVMQDGKSGGLETYYSTSSLEDAAAVFKFGADNTSVEWKLDVYNDKGDKTAIIGTSGKEGSVFSDKQSELNVKGDKVVDMHSHPYNDKASGQDMNNLKVGIGAVYHRDSKVLFFYDSRNSRIESEEYKIDTSKTLLDKLNDKFMK